jgi:hypothetical protein
MRELVGDGTWAGVLRVFVDGDDLVVQNVKATCWGSDDDPMDNGVSASGLNTRDHPEYLGISLPMRVPTQSSALKKAIGGSPIPKLPWHTPVKVYSHSTGKIVYGSLIDIGPAKWSGHGIDLMNSVVKALGLNVDDGVFAVDFRIIGGAKYIVAS